MFKICRSMKCIAKLQLKGASSIILNLLEFWSTVLKIRTNNKCSFLNADTFPIRITQSLTIYHSIKSFTTPNFFLIQIMMFPHIKTWYFVFYRLFWRCPLPFQNDDFSCSLFRITDAIIYTYILQTSMINLINPISIAIPTVVVYVLLLSVSSFLGT